MKEVLSHRVLAFTLSLLMLVSSSGISMEMHYCMGRLQDISVFGNSKSCIPATLQTSCETATNQTELSSSDRLSKAMGSCCRNTKIHIDSSDDEFSTTQEITILQDQITFLVSLVYTFFLPTYELHTTNFYTYRPPPLCQDITILTQHFLC